MKVMRKMEVSVNEKSVDFKVGNQSHVEVSIQTSQLMKGLPVTKDTLDSLIGKPVYDSNGNTIGVVSNYSDDKEVIFLDLTDGYLNDFDGDIMATVQVDKCKMCNGGKL